MRCRTSTGWLTTRSAGTQSALLPESRLFGSSH
jgi:hypothetical protein